MVSILGYLADTIRGYTTNTTKLTCEPLICLAVAQQWSDGKINKRRDREFDTPPG
jgi:hypothetical protein